MIKTAEAVSLGHPDKISDYISSYILDRMIEQDVAVRFAVEVMIKGNCVVLGGEISGNVSLDKLNEYVLSALAEIGYTEEYAKRWQEFSIQPSKLQIINLIGQQSAEINMGIENDGWGDQGVFVGYACQGEGLINRELFLARKLNKYLYEKALTSDNLGLDIKTQITLSDNKIETVIVAIPMLEYEDLSDDILRTINDVPQKLIINGTGQYKHHASIADCGITGRKLACDFYSTACPIGGGSPWTKDCSKADLTLNLYARKLAIENLSDNDECFVYLSSCIGKAELPSAVIKTIKNGEIIYKSLMFNQSPKELAHVLGLNKPIYANLCRKGITSI